MTEFIDWNNLKNPVYSYKNWSVKDACMEYKDGVFYIFFSAFYWDRMKTRSHVVEISTKDWKTFSHPLLHIDGREEGWTGLCSPNITKINGKYYLTFNSWGEKHPNKRTNQLFFMESNDLIHWSNIKQVARNLTEKDRVIDIAISFENNKYYIVWKYREKSGLVNKDHVRIATASTLDRDAIYIGNGGFAEFYLKDGSKSSKTHENFQIIKIDGIWYLLSTDYIPHSPWFYKISGDGRGHNDEDWLRWVDGYEFKIPQEAFNTNHLANAAFLTDWRQFNGHFYLLYAGRTEGRSHALRGDNKLGLARSKDLFNFEVP